MRLKNWAQKFGMGDPKKRALLQPRVSLGKVWESFILCGTVSSMSAVMSTINNKPLSHCRNFFRNPHQGTRNHLVQCLRSAPRYVFPCLVSAYTELLLLWFANLILNLSEHFHPKINRLRTRKYRTWNGACIIVLLQWRQIGGNAGRFAR